MNYAKGMVLGVDDFTQEFAYLSGRDQWLARELLGYGTTSGLRGHRRGRRRRRPACACGARRGRRTQRKARLRARPISARVINKWLAKPENAATVNGADRLTRRSPPLSPPVSTATISLYLTLCYADCPTAPVPIPGEPCRSEDELMAPSRIADDYSLELRTDAPLGRSRKTPCAISSRWLRNNVPVVDAPARRRRRRGKPGSQALAGGRAALVRRRVHEFAARRRRPSVARSATSFFDSPPTSLTDRAATSCAHSCASPSASG